MGTIDIARELFDQYAASETWSAGEVEDYQRRLLPKLVRHARDNVPFYARRLDALFRADGSIDLDRWGDLPIVTRRDMAAHRDAMQARTMPRGSGPVGTIKTSGSSGVPITISVNGYTALVNNTLRWRLHGWHDIDWSRTICVREGEDRAVAAYPDGRELPPWGPPFLEVSRKGVAWAINRFSRPEEQAEFLARRQCDYFVVNPKAAHVLALTVERNGIDLKLDAILAQAENVGEDDREICRRAMGARIIGAYASKEGGQMAHPCPLGRLHVNAEQVLLEIIDKDGQPCPPGVQGRVIITPLFQTAQPLIRYEQGDLTAFAGPCPCGRHGPIIEPVQGRTMALFYHPDGRALARLLPEPMRDTLQCEFWQIAQIGPNLYEVRYVPRKWSEYGDEAGFVEEFRSIFFEDAEVTLRRVREIPLTAAGKLIEYVNEYTRKTVTATA